MTEQELHDLQRMVAVAVEALDDIKAKDISVLETQDKTSLFARMIIASGDSTRRSLTRATSSSTSCSRPCATSTTSTPSGAAKNPNSTTAPPNPGTPQTDPPAAKRRGRLKPQKVSDGLKAKESTP